MAPDTFCRELTSSLPELFACEDRGEYTRIRTPYLYPDGDYIDIFCKPEDSTVLITDLGETTRWLRTQTLSPRRTKKQQALLQDICLTHGVELFKGMLTFRCPDLDRLAADVTRVAQTAIRVSDLSLTYRALAVESVNDEVADFLREQELPYQRNEKLTGRSGRSWTLDFHVRAPERTSLMYVLSTGNRSTAKSLVERTVAAFHDLQSRKWNDNTGFVTLVDDTTDVWTEENFRLAEQVSDVVRWSAPDEVLRQLRAAA